MLTEEPVETIHVYIVKEDAVQQETPVIDSSLHDTAKTDTQPLVSPSYPRHGQLVPYLLIAAHLLIVLFALFAQLYLTLTETATITIIPKRAVVTAHLSLTNVQSRIFSPVTLAQSKTVPATGTGHQDATQAGGTITLFNAATHKQTIEAGTLLIGSDGAHIVTDQIADVPGATPPLEGQTTVPAHAVNKGAAGNIHAGDISGVCCRENIFAYNSAFSGGQDERTYTIVRQADIHGVVLSIAPPLIGSIQASFQEQIRPGETLTPNLCSQKVSPDRNVGDEATYVAVTVTESCIAAAYITTDLHAKVKQALAAQAEQTIGTGYLLSSYSQTSPMKTSVQQGRLVIVGTFQGRMIYYFSSQDLTTLRQQLVGKSRQQGIAILSHLHGAEHITVQGEKTGTFPTDPTHIHILFLHVS